jgi:hypothetical protein
MTLIKINVWRRIGINLYFYRETIKLKQGLGWFIL